MNLRVMLVCVLCCLFVGASPERLPQPRWQGMNVTLHSGRSYRVLLEHLRAMGANRVALVIACEQKGTDLICDNAPSEQEIRLTMRDARQVGLTVLLKPHVETKEFSWRGEIDFGEADVREWFLIYGRWIHRLADLEPDGLVVGTELAKLSAYESEWRTLIQQVRTHYRGEVHYAAHFAEAPQVRWWDAVDAIGVDAYYPLSDDLMESWRPYRDELAELAKRFNKPVVFLEVGYQSRVDSFRTPWQRDPAIPSLGSQVSAYEAVFETFANEPWWGGALWWDAGKVWYGGLLFFDWEIGHYNSWNVGFTPIGKPAANVLRHYWEISNLP